MAEQKQEERKQEHEQELYDGKWCCYLRPAPPEISLDTHYTYNQVMGAIRMQRWYPRYCYYCYCCPLRDPDDWERHVIRYHAGKLAYLGSAPLTTVKILTIIQDRDISLAYDDDNVELGGPRND